MDDWMGVEIWLPPGGRLDHIRREVWDLLKSAGFVEDFEGDPCGMIGPHGSYAHFYPMDKPAFTRARDGGAAPAESVPVVLPFALPAGELPPSRRAGIRASSPWRTDG
jgi:hypothetical protein